jgi:hypothetical protein
VEVGKAVSIFLVPFFQERHLLTACAVPARPRRL